MIYGFEVRDSDSLFVQSVWRSRSEGGGSFLSTAASQWEMVVTRQRGRLTLSVRGPETKASSAQVPENAEFLGIIFKHGVFMPRLPKSELVNHEIHLNESGNNAFQFFDSTWEFPTFENVDIFVDRLARAQILSFDPVVEDAYRGGPLSLSRRAVQRRFVYVTGLTYKTIQQIDRARHASLLLGKGLPAVEAAYEAGYFDQSHLTNALKRFYGQTPLEIARQSTFHSGVFFQDEQL